MKSKKIFVLLAILIILCSSICAVSAGWFDNKITVNGMDFNIPEGYEEGSSGPSANKYLILGYTGEYKICHDKGNNYGNEIWITVIDKNPNGTTLSLSDAVFPEKFRDLKNDTIGNKTGISYKSSSFPYTKTFVYIVNGKLIEIMVPTDVNIEDIIR